MREDQFERLVNVVNSFVEMARDGKLKSFKITEQQNCIPNAIQITYKSELANIGWKILLGLIIIATVIYFK